jgi:tetratricopeptide (TPR) repeat protein
VSLRLIPILLLPVCALGQPIWMDDGLAQNGEMRRARLGPGTGGFERSDPEVFGGTDRTARESENLFGLEHVIPELNDARNKPISGLVSVNQLQHPPSKKAIRLLIDAQRYSQAHDTARAAEKLRQAIRLDPSFREAHLNLGVQYARTSQISEAMAEFQRALDIGPPDAKAYSNLAYCYIRIGAFQEAEDAAGRALHLEPANAPAQQLYRVAVNARHQTQAR